MTTRVLFVDDEPAVLAGIRRMLRRFHSRWDIVLANSGQEALTLMSESPFHVLVTDMRMPGMDGEQLLREVKQRFPRVVRFVLSGFSDEAAIMRSVGLAHQYLSKPCDPEALINKISRACDLRQSACPDALKDVVSRISSLPSPPTTYRQLLAELQSVEASINRVGDIIAQDVGMTAKLLQLVNSSFFGMPQRVETPQRAASLLGLRTLTPLIMSAGLFSQFERSSVEGFSLEAVMARCVTSSRLAGKVAATLDADNETVDASVLAGLLHDAGQLLLASELPKDFCAALEMASQEDIPLWEAEAVTCGASHAEIGGYLLDLWGLPRSIVDAVTYHHQPTRATADPVTVLAATHVASALTDEVAASAGTPSHDLLDMSFLEQHKFADKLATWQEIAEDLFAVRAE